MALYPLLLISEIIRIVNEVHNNLKTLVSIVLSAHELAKKPSLVIRKLKEGLVPFAIGKYFVKSSHEFNFWRILRFQLLSK